MYLFLISWVILIYKYVSYHLYYAIQTNIYTIYTFKSS